MKFQRTLAIKNFRRKPARTAALILIAAFLTFSVFGGSVIIFSLQNGLGSYQSRLGADIVAVPNSARSKGEFESILLQGIPGTFYMDAGDYRKIAEIDGVETAAPQFYLASTSAGCCSVAVQIIGFDPQLDFTVQPWIREQYADTLQTGDIIIGSELNLPEDKTLKFYDTSCNVVAQLDRTGTGLDTAVYANMDTIRLMIQNAKALGFSIVDGVDPASAVSSVMVKVADGYNVEQVTGEINVHVRHIEAAQAANMLSGISGGLANVSRIIRVLTIMIWILAIVILSVAFAMISHERAKEFAVLRTMGASRRMVSGMLLVESGLISAFGAVLGLAASCLVVFPFGRLLSARLELPWLLPSAGIIAAAAAGSLIISVAAGALTSAVSAWRISRRDTAFAMREGT